jgi:hypothetical protein
MTSPRNDMIIEVSFNSHAPKSPAQIRLDARLRNTATSRRVPDVDAAAKRAKAALANRLSELQKKAEQKRVAVRPRSLLI